MRQKRFTLCLFMDVVLCFLLPLGMALVTFTLAVLLRTSVKTLFQQKVNSGIVVNISKKP